MSKKESPNKQVSASDITSSQDNLEADLRELFREYAESRTVLLVFFDKQGHTVSIGSGTCVKIGEKCFIFTAGHVIKDAFGMGYSLSIIGSGPRHIEVTSDLSDNYQRDRNVDHAYIEVEMNQVDSLGKKFLSLDQIQGNVNHASRRPAVIIGYPWEVKRETLVPGTEHYRRILSTRLFTTATVSPEDWLENPNDMPVDPDDPFGRWNVNSHILLVYDDVGIRHDTGERVSVPNPGGMSGGGIWIFNRIDSGLIPYYTITLIGIQRGLYRQSRLFLATQIQHLLMLIANRIPAIRDVIIEHLHPVDNIPI